MKLQTAGLITVKDNKLLLAFSKHKNAWYLPGGKLDKGESASEALIREIEEELSLRIVQEELAYYCHVSAPAFGEAAQVIMEQDCFLYDLKSPIQVSNEIGAVKYFSYHDYLKEPIRVCGVLTVFQNLMRDHLI